jgi:hypothetical protein
MLNTGSFYPRGSEAMSGEYTVAASLLDTAINQAEEDNAMDPDAMALAILSLVLRKLSEYRSRADIESCIDYDLDNVIEQDQVITRGC